MKDFRILIVEDDRALADSLKEQYRAEFGSLGYSPIGVEMAHTAQEAKDLAKANSGKPYNLVSLDVNLGPAPELGAAPLTGLDVLKVFKRFKSSWMVSLLTGVETDVTLNESVGRGAAEKLRKQLRQMAYANFFPDRLQVIEKPSAAEWAADPAAAQNLLNNRIKQIALVYREIARLRYVFRKLEVEGLERVVAKKGAGKATEKRATAPIKTIHWQLRYDCGELRTLPDRAMFRPIHKLLTLDEGESLPPETLQALEPQWKTKKEDRPSAPVDGNPFVSFFNRLGVDWENLADEQRMLLVKATLGKKLQRYVELRKLEDIEPEGDLSPDEEDELAELRTDLGELLDVAEERYQRTLADDYRADDAEEKSIAEGLLAGTLHVVSGGNYQKPQGARGWDSKDGVNFRKRKSMFYDYLRENGFGEMADHLEESIKSTGSNWSYDPKRLIEWTT